MATIRLGRYEAEEGNLPEVCVRCGAPATDWKKKRFSWCPPWVGALILVLLAYIIVAAIMTKRMTVQLPFCAEHKNHWSRRTLIIWLSFLGLAIVGIVALIAMSSSGNQGPGPLAGSLCIGFIVLGVAWLILAIVLQNTAIRPNEITDNSITLVKVSEAFVDAVEEDREGRRRGGDEDEDEDRPRSRRRARDEDDEDRPRRPTKEDKGGIYDPNARRGSRPPRDEDDKR